MKFIVCLVAGVLLCYAGYVQPAYAEEAGQTLQLAPQNNTGPSLDETLKFIKDKVDSLKGYTYWNTGGATKQVVYTSFDLGSDYTATFKQKVVSAEKPFFNSIEHDECDLKSLYDVKISDSHPTLLRLYFHNNCKKLGASLDGYPRNPPFYNGSMLIDAGDADLAERLAKAFNHAMPMLEKLPKSRSTNKELF